MPSRARPSENGRDRDQGEIKNGEEPSNAISARARHIGLSAPLRTKSWRGRDSARDQIGPFMAIRTHTSRGKYSRARNCTFWAAIVPPNGRRQLARVTWPVKAGVRPPIGSFPPTDLFSRGPTIEAGLADQPAAKIVIDEAARGRIRPLFALHADGGSDASIMGQDKKVLSPPLAGKMQRGRTGIRCPSLQFSDAFNYYSMAYASWRQVGFYATNGVQCKMPRRSASPSPRTCSALSARAWRPVKYASTSEALRDAVRIWQRQRSENAERLTAIKTRVRRSLEDPRPGVPLDEAFDRIEELHADTVKARKDASA